MEKTNIEIVPISPVIGAEIHGIDLRNPLRKSDRDTIYQALLTYKVVFFRDQDLTSEQHIAFGRAFGSLNTALKPDALYPEILHIDADGKNKNAADVWHSDHSDYRIPPLGSILRGIVLPSLGGDTIFSSAISAYAALSAPVKAWIENLRATHDIWPNIHRYNLTPEQIEEKRKTQTSFEHPVVALHPDTSERLIFVNNYYTTRVVDVDRAESEAILRILFEEIQRPEHHVRFSWKKNSIAFWDNRAVQHYAPGDYNEPRKMERITIEGQGRVSGPHDKVVPYILPILP